MPADTKDPSNPIAEFAGALNPPTGALADSLPFSLTAEAAKPTAGAEEQPGLFSEDHEQ
ncbi:MAG: hypothetical protein WBC51_03730 [Vicinamibacterales bacterium]